jgi:hypothetical protein
VIAAELRASLEAERCWHHVSGLIRARRKGGLAALVGSRKGDDYGVRIDGWTPDALEIFVLLWSASHALNELAGVSHKAWVALNFEVNRGRIWYTSPINDGVADVLGIEPEEAKRLYAAGVEYMHSEIAGHELSEEWWWVLDKG